VAVPVHFLVPAKNEEAHEMARTSRAHTPIRISVGRIAAAALALGGLATLVLAPDAGAAAPTQTATTISAAQNAKYGTILTAGNTVYILKPSKTPCTGKCLKVWPPVLLPQGTTAAIAGPGVDQTKLGTQSVAGGNLQITYGGKPLYWYVKDKAPGQVKGNIKDKWGKWISVVTVKGKVNPSSGSNGGGGSKTNTGTGGTSF
jgi:predicted lipoprotein with Yx(FWY)xxD motif